MKKTLLSLIALIMAGAFALPAMAADEKKAEAPKKRQFTGVIESVDAAAKTMAVKNAAGDVRTFTCSDKCKYVTVTKAAAEMTDIKVGEKVTCHYTEENGKLICHKCAPPESSKKKDAKGDAAK